MTPDEWDGIALLIEHGWKGEFDDDAQAAYRILLDGFSADQVTVALRVLLRTGTVHVPAAAEIVQTIEADPDLPTFEEMLEAVYGPGGVIHARARGVPDRGWWEIGERERADELAQLAKAGECGPLIERFVRQVGPGWLGRQRPQGEYMFHRRRDLKEEWERFVDVAQRRDVYALAMPRRGGELQQVDPLKAIEQGQGR